MGKGIINQHLITGNVTWSALITEEIGSSDSDNSINLGVHNIDNLFLIPFRYGYVTDDITPNRMAIGQYFNSLSGGEVELVGERNATGDSMEFGGIVLEFENITYRDFGILDRHDEESTIIDFSRSLDQSKILVSATMTSQYSTLNDSRWFHIFPFIEEIGENSVEIIHGTEIDELYYQIIELG